MFYLFSLYRNAYATHLGGDVIRNAIADKLGSQSAYLMKPNRQNGL